MNHFRSLIKKEVKELLTRHFVLSIVFIIVFFGFMGKIVRGTKEEIGKELKISLLDLDQTPFLQNILNTIEQHGIMIHEIENEIIGVAIKEAKEKTATVLLVIPKGFGGKIQRMERGELHVYSMMKGISVSEAISSKAVKLVIDILNRSITTHFLRENIPGKDPANIMSPIDIKDFVVIKGRTISGSPDMISALTTSQSVMIPLVLMIVIIFAGMMIMTSMGSEKENKTLETLLTLPVGRLTIIGGKMMGAAIVASVMTSAYMIGLRYYMSSFTESAKAPFFLEDLGLSITPFGYLLLGISLFMAILFALSICIDLGIFVQDTKSAQTMNLPLSMSVFIPYFLSMFRDIETLPLSLKILLYAIPFSHPIVAPKFLIFHNYSMVIGGIVYMTILTCMAMWVGVRLFNTDKVLTARLALKLRK